MKHEEILKSWFSLLIAIPELSEAECKKLLDYEVKHKNRREVVRRLHGRVNKLRRAREKEELGYGK